MTGVLHRKEKKADSRRATWAAPHKGRLNLVQERLRWNSYLEFISCDNDPLVSCCCVSFWTQANAEIIWKKQFRWGSTIISDAASVEEKVGGNFKDKKKSYISQLLGRWFPYCHLGQYVCNVLLEFSDINHQSFSPSFSDGGKRIDFLFMPLFAEVGLIN